MTGISRVTMTTIVSAIMLITLAPNAEGYSYGGTDDGGRCSICGKFTLRGSTHLCKPKKKSRGFVVQRGEDKHSTNVEMKQEPLPDALKPFSGYLDSKTIEQDAREWTDDKGKKINAVWLHVSKLGDEVRLMNTKSGKKFTVKTSSLSLTDKKYVANYIDGEKAKGNTWYGGVYITEQEIKEFERYEEAKSIVREKDIDVSFLTSLKAFQVLGKEALCWAYRLDYEGRERQEGDDPVKFIPSKTRFMVDGETISCRFFWCGTFNYETKGGRDRTIACLTDNPVFAIKQVLASLSDTGTNSNSRPSNGDSVEYTLQSTGSGFFITTDGYLITNHHVIEDGRKFAVLTDAGRIEAKLIYADADTDLALLKVDDKVGIIPFKLAGKRTEKLGTSILTMGFPQPGLQGFDPKVTRGIISGERGFMGDVRQYQIDASVQPGNSGGPLFNEHGCVVGVVVASLRKGQVVNYAIKKSYLMAFLDNSPECSNGIVECDDCGKPNHDVEDMISNVRKSCVLVLNYQ